MEIEKTYRTRLSCGRFRAFSIRAGETDLLVGIDRDHFDASLAFALGARVHALRATLERYIARNRWFAASFSPVDPSAGMPEIARTMAAEGRIACVGPMAAVAGCIADAALSFLVGEKGVHEAFVENGGDCALRVVAPIAVAIGAGESEFSEGLAIELPAGTWGVATSSGRLGHSKSFGRADACAVVGGSSGRADAWATALGNLIGGSHDLEPVAGKAADAAGVLAFFAAAGDKIAYKGPFPLKPAGTAKGAAHGCRA